MAIASSLGAAILFDQHLPRVILFFAFSQLYRLKLKVNSARAAGFSRSLVFLFVFPAQYVQAQQVHMYERVLRGCPWKGLSQLSVGTHCSELVGSRHSLP